AHADLDGRELRDGQVGPDARFVHGARRGRGVASREPLYPDRSRRLHRQHGQEVHQLQALAGPRRRRALLPRAQGRPAGPDGREGIRCVGVHRAEQHRRGPRPEPARGAAQAPVVARGDRARYFPVPVSRTFTLLLAAAVVAASTIPHLLSGQQPPSRRQARGRRPAPPPALRTTAQRIPTPRSVLGFEPGDERKLADWPTLVRYYQALAGASDRMRYRELGRSTLGAPFVALVISSPQNLRRLDYYRELNARLADPRGLKTAKDATAALKDAKTVVLITSGIHSNEVGGHLTPAILAYRLATDTSA